RDRLCGFGVAAEAEEGLRAGGGVEPCPVGGNLLERRQVLQDPLAQPGRSLPADGGVVADLGQQVLHEGCVDVRIAVLAEVRSRAALVEAGGPGPALGLSPGAPPPPPAAAP